MQTSSTAAPLPPPALYMPPTVFWHTTLGHQMRQLTQRPDTQGAAVPSFSAQASATAIGGLFVSLWRADQVAMPR
ncbi:MAG: hypothetical protein ABIV47_25205 [Roseiflexaceae bacterium]